MFKRHHPQRIGHARLSFVVGDELGNQEQADPLGACCPIGQAGQNKVADVLGEVIVAPADKDLLAGHRVAAVPVWDGFGRQCPHIRSRLGFGQVHGAAPFATYQLGQIDRFDLIAGVMFERLDLALRHQRV